MKISYRRVQAVGMVCAVAVGLAVGALLTSVILADLPATDDQAAGGHAVGDHIVGVPVAQVYPSQNQVDRARAAAAAKAAQVAQIRSALAAATARADAAGLALEQAAEAYDLARIQLDQRGQAVAAADSAAATARAGLHTAQRDVGRIADVEYRSGGVSTLGLLLDSAGPDSVLERSFLLGAVGDGQGEALRRMAARRQVADELGRRAEDALHAQKAAADALAQARARAQASAQQAQAAQAQVAAEQSRLTAQLATLQATSTRLVQQRAAGLAAAARARAAAARARAAAARGGGFGGRWSSLGSSAHGSSAGGLAAVAWARRQVGLPYQWGAAGPGSYDCSGLTMRAWQSAGVSLFHNAAMQYQQVRHVTYSDLRPGDLIFYATNPADPGTIHHVTLYAGGGRMVEAPATGLDVRVTAIRRGGAMPFAGRP